MSLITSCPACGTMFRVVPDQLKISEGWVRCGHCAEVFDASVHLAEESLPTPAPQAPVEAPAPAPAAVAPASEPLPEEAIRGWEATAGAPLASVPMPLARTTPDRPLPATVLRPMPPVEPPPHSQFGPDSQSLEPSSLDAPFVFRRSDFDHGALPSVLPPAPGDSQLHEDEVSQLPQDEPEVEQVSFVRQARRKAWWRRPLVRAGLGLCALLLAAGLLLQLAYRDRDRLAASLPELRPVLAQMCDWLQCRLAHPRQIEAIVIDSSGFNRLRGDTYRLTFNVRNTAGMRVAAPWLELTLTDPQDQPLVRRVLAPGELGASDGFIPAGSEWAGTAGVTVSSTSAGRVSGYRLLAFYP